MSATVPEQVTPTGPGSVSGAPNLPDGLTDTFASRYGAGPLLLAESSGEGAANTMKLVADNVQTLVIPGIGHWHAEQAPEEMTAALTGFLAPYGDGHGTGRDTGSGS